MTAITPARWPHVPREPKDPDAVLDYGIDWSDWLAEGESVATAEWIVTGGTLDSAQRDGSLCVAWVSGGTDGGTLTLTCRVTTDHVPPRTDDRSLTIRVRST